MKLLELERRRRGLTQVAVALKVGVDPSFIRHIEAGRWRPSTTSPAAKRLSRLLGKPLEELLAEVDERIPAAVASRAK